MTIRSVASLRFCTTKPVRQVHVHFQSLRGFKKLEI